MIRRAGGGATIPLAAVAILLLAAPAPAAEYRTGNVVMGTVLQVTVVADTAERARSLATLAIDQTRHWDDVLTTWRPEGELHRLNLSAGQTATPITADLQFSLEAMLRLADATGGAFNPAVGARLERWRDPAKRAGPVSAKPVGLLSKVLTVGRGKAALAKGVALDAGAIGKGIALDAIAASLRDRGARAFLLDFGGSSQLAWNGAGHDWQLALAGLGEGAIRGRLPLIDFALATSRSATELQEGGPIVNPATGERVVEARLCTVLAASAADADAWSTALVVLGRDGWARARAAAVEYFCEDGAGVVSSPGFRAQLE